MRELPPPPGPAKAQVSHATGAAQSDLEFIPPPK